MGAGVGAGVPGLVGAAPPVAHCQYHSLDLWHLNPSTQAAQALSPQVDPAGQLLLPPHCVHPGFAAPDGTGTGTGAGTGVGTGVGTGAGLGVGVGTGAGVGVMGVGMEAPVLHCQYHSLVLWQLLPLVQAAHALSPQMDPGGQALLPPHCCQRLTAAAAREGRCRRMSAWRPDWGIW